MCVLQTNNFRPGGLHIHSSSLRPRICPCVCVQQFRKQRPTSSISSSCIEARVELFTVCGTLSASTQLIHLPTSPVLFNCRERIIIAPLRAPAADDWGNREILHGAGADATN